MNPHSFAAFLATSFVLAVAPGPGVVYIVARTAAQGRRAGLASVAGVALGNLCNAVAASFGLATLFAASAAAFTVVKWAGAAYLIYLGVRALRPVRSTAVSSEFRAPGHNAVFREGFTVGVLNPKTALFFAALLPQFMEPAQSAAIQGIVLAVVFVGIAVVTDGAYVLATSSAKAQLGSSPTMQRLGRYATAATLVGLGLFAAASGSRVTR
ncbi:MAG: LysE family translocator [Burkholderiaceae bacterium]